MTERPDTTRAAHRKAGVSLRRKVTGYVATAVSLITTLVVAVLAIHIVFVAFEANTGNPIVDWFGDAARTLAWEFVDVFRPGDPKMDVAVNYGLAALVYLVAGRIAVALVRRAAP
ncbi:hypothetical protein BTM25_12910 [Actinomadura rubteroloni]|uniref:YggT family protein n=1 Tax=Actinomadura rubteroloni TaxID=1926885 RepID=A0A2P4UPC1_9ACTN|nr:hypothetical protein BTM25_12910 [Actinomadura rubteroloni]